MFSDENLLILTILINVILTSISATEMGEIGEALHRNRRQLLYPNSTLLQFNAGLGFPSVVKNVNVNYAFQANFQLPWNRTQIPIDILNANTGYTETARKKRETGIKDDENGDYHDDAKLYYFYKHVEDLLDGNFKGSRATLEPANHWLQHDWVSSTGFGYNGQSCVLQTLCQLGAEPLHSDDEEDLLHEIASFVLNPSNDESHTLTEGDEAYPYIKAYRNGQNHQDCSTLYQGCSISLIDAFTKLHDTSKENNKPFA